MTNNLLLEIFEKVNFCYNHKKEDATPPTQTYLRHF